jgi:hypothetical protein
VAVLPPAVRPDPDAPLPPDGVLGSAVAVVEAGASSGSSDGEGED